ncbi:hypothetical protein V3C99_016513, partial [Haemonchus contortus]
GFCTRILISHSNDRSPEQSLRKFLRIDPLSRSCSEKVSRAATLRNGSVFPLQPYGMLPLLSGIEDEPLRCQKGDDREQRTHRGFVTPPGRGSPATMEST